MKPSLNRLHDESRLHLARFGIEQARPVFLPLDLLALADVSTDIAFRISSSKGMSPEGAAATLMGMFGEDSRKCLTIERGYLNFSIPDPWDCALRYTGAPFTVPARARIRIAALAAEFPLLERLRMVACAILQQRMLSNLGADAVLLLGNDRIQHRSGPETAGTLLRAVLQAFPQVNDDEPREADSGGEPEYVWTMPEFERSRGRRLDAAAFGQSIRRYCYADPLNRQPLHWAGRSGDLDRFLDWSDEELTALTISLAGPLEGGVFDPAVARLAERKNVRWHASSLLHRLSALGIAREESREIDSSDAPPELLDRRLLVLMALLSDRFHLAATDARITEYWRSLSEFLLVSERILNSPALRGRFRTDSIGASGKALLWRLFCQVERFGVQAVE